MKMLGILAIATLLAGAGCGRQSNTTQTQTPSPGRAMETLQFWDAFNQAAVSGVGTEVMTKNAWQEGIEPTDIIAILNDVAAGERARFKAINSLPVLHVDPDLTAYAIAYAKTRMELTTALEDYANLIRKQEELTSMPVLGIGLLVQLLNHSEDSEDGILWRALIDQAKQTTGDLQQLKTPTLALEERVAGVRTTLSDLATVEMAVRVKLAQRFDREFPPRDSYVKVTGINDGELRPTDQEIMNALIGKSVGERPNRWKFDSLKEFVSFQVTGVTQRTDVLTDVFVETHVKGAFTGNERDLSLRLTYGKLYTRQKLLEVSLNSTMKTAANMRN